MFRTLPLTRIPLLGLLAAGCSNGGSAEPRPPTGDLSAPSVTTHFPPRASMTTARRLVVRGRATDPSGVARIALNGVLATSDDEFATWSVPVELEQGDNTLELEAVDRKGNRAASATRILTRHAALGRLPRGIVLDDVRRRLHAVDRERFELLAQDLDTGDRWLVSGADRGIGPRLVDPGPLAFDPGTDRAFVAARNRVYTVELATGDRAQLTGAGVGAGPDLVGIWGIDLDASRGRILVADAEQNAVLAVDAMTGDRRILSGAGVGAGPELDVPRGVRVVPGTGRALATSQDALLWIDLPSGDRTVASDAQHGTGPSLGSPLWIDLDIVGGRAIVYDAISEYVLAVDLVTGDRQAASPVFRAGGIAVDGRRNRVLATGADQIVIAIDLTRLWMRRWIHDRTRFGSGVGFSAVALLRDPTSRRTFLFGRNVIELSPQGVSVRLSADFSNPTDFDFDPSSDGSMLVVDSGRLWGFDPQTGRRRVISDRFRNRAKYVAADPRKPAAYVLVTGLPAPTALFEVDLRDGTVRSVAVAQNPVDIAFDANRRRVLLLDADSSQLVWLDPRDGSVLLASGLLRGSGPEPQVPRGMVFDATRDTAYVTDSGLLAVLAVDLATGDRTIVSDRQSRGAPFVAPRGIAFDPVGRTVLVIDDGIVEVDLDTGDRTFLRR